MKKYFILTLFISLSYFVNSQTLPTTADNTVSTSEDIDKVFGVVDFPFIDPDPGASLWQIRITSNVSTGTLYDDSNLNGVIDGGETLGAGDIVLVSNFNRFKFKPLPDQNGVGYDQFDFQVHDGVDGWSALPASTMTIDVTAVNDDPVVTTNTGKAVNEGATNQVIAQAELETTDVEEGPGSLTYTLNSIPVNGTLTNGGPPLGVGGTFTQADINAGNVEYNHDGSETISDAFTFSVDDGAGGSTPVTAFSITVTPVNDPPVLVNNTGKTVNEGAANQIIPNTELLVTDVDNTNAQIEYTLTTIPTNGTLFCGGALGLGSTFTQANINANMLQYTHDGSETVADLFRFTVSDGAGGNIGLTQFDITITPQNDDPVVTTNTGKTVSEGAANQTILNTELETTDAESGPALLTYTLSAVPANGTLTNGGPPLGIGGTFTQLDINSNNVEYNHDGSETISDSFTFTVDDGTGGTTVATVFVITVTPVNDDPVLAVNTGKTVNEGANNQIILNTELRVTDVDNTDAQIEYTVTVIPTNGTLFNNAVPLAVGNTFTQTDINLNNINYSHDGTETVADFFRFTVSDGAGGNIPQTQFDFTITPLNDDPVVTTNNGKTVAEGAVNQTIVITDLETTDTDNTPAQLTYTVSAVPANGNLTNSGVPILPLGNFTQLDINSNNIEYDHDGSEPNADSFTFTVDDGAGGTTAATTFNITITSVNDAPVLATNNPLNINEGDINQGIPNTLLQVTDVDNTPAEIEFTLTTAPASGTLYLSGVPVAVAGTFTQAQIDANAITYSHDGTETVADFFRFTVNDGAGGNIGVTQFDINIAPVNDAPTFDTSPVTVGAELVLYTYNISASDPDHPGPALSFAAVTIPPWLALVDNGNGTATLSGTPPGGAPLNNPMSISVTDGTETVFQNWNLMITSGVTANAGLDDTTCVDDSYILNGNQPPAGYTGLWTVIDGAGVFVDETLYNTQVDGLNSGVAPNNSNTFRWTLSNADGSYVVWDDVVIINNTVISEVTDISNVCGTNAILQADNALFPGESGLWTVEGSPVPLPVIANPTQRTTAVSGLNFNINQFRWTVTKETCSDFAIMTVDVIEVWATAGGPAEICSEPFTIYGNDPALLGGTGLWTVGGGGGTFANANNPTTTVTGSHQDVTNQYIWTVTVNGCSDQASVFVENNIPTTAVITTPDPSTSCNGTYTIIAVPADATDPNETGFWTTVTPGVIIATPNNATTNVSNLQQGANLFTWHITNGNCPESTADLTINYYILTAVDAGPDAVICTDIYNLAGSALDPGETGFWEFTTGGLGSTIIDPTSNNTQVINLQRGINVLQWTVSHDICSSDDEVEITNMSVTAEINSATEPDTLIACTDPSPLVTANDPAGQDIANPATPATGSWSVLSGGGIVDSPLSWNTTFSNLDEGTNKFIWTITNGICTDTDTITVINSIPTQAYAGKDTIVCSTSLPNLNGNNYNSAVEIGFWTRIAGGATITDPSSISTSVTNLDYYCTPWTPDWWTNQAAVNIFQWNIVRGTCPASTDQVSVMNGLPETIDAGLDQTVCDNVVNLDALDEASCADEYWWEQLPDVGNYIDPFSGAFIPDNDLNMPFNVHVDNIQDGMTQFVWHKRNNYFDSMGNPIVCAVTDTVEITSLGFEEDVDAGQNKAVCASEWILNSTPPSAIIANSAFSTNVTGSWSVTFGNGNFDDDTYYNTTVRNMGYYTNVYRWTITDNDNGCDMSDDVYIHNGLPSNAQTGPDREICYDYAVISANNPARSDDQWWEVYTGGGTLTGATCSNIFCTAQVDNLSPGVNVFVWHVTEDYPSGTEWVGPIPPYHAGNILTCELTDTLKITNNGVTANAGNTIYICEDTAQLNAVVLAGTTGQWLASTGTFASTGGLTSSLYNDVVLGLTRGKNTFRWTLTNGDCSDSDQLIVWDNLPDPDPNAGADEIICEDSTILTSNSITRNNTWYDVTGTTVTQEGYSTQGWTVYIGSGTFDNSSMTNTWVRNVGLGSNSYFWNAYYHFTDYTYEPVPGVPYTQTCHLKDTVNITNNSVIANAGTDIDDICGTELLNSTVTLSATPPNLALGQTGVWTIANSVGVIQTPTLFNTVVNNMDRGENEFRWRISNSDCIDNDLVSVFVYMPTTAGAGADQVVCRDAATNITLIANDPAFGTGTWSVVSGGGTIHTPTNFTTTVNNLALDRSFFRWSIVDNPSCPASIDEIMITNNYVEADAGPDQDLCIATATLAANDPGTYFHGFEVPSGQWTVAQGVGLTFDSDTRYNAVVSNLDDTQTNILRWTITKGFCSATDEINIENNYFTVSADIDQTVCDDWAFLNGQQPTPVLENGKWTVIGGGGSFVNETLYNTQVNSLPPGPNTFKWTITNTTGANCEASDNVEIYNNKVESDAGITQRLCADNTNLDGNLPSPAGATGNWVITLGSASITTPNSNTTEVTNLLSGQNTFEWTISRTINSKLCTDATTVDIYNDQPTAADVEDDKPVCSYNSTLKVDVIPTIGTGVWTAVDNLAVIDNSLSFNANVTGLNRGINTFRWTVTNQACTSIDDLVITNNVVVSDAGIDKSTACLDQTTLSGNNPAVTQGTGFWTDLNGTSAVITDNTLYNTTVTNLRPGTTEFEWFVSLGDCEAPDRVIITNNQITATAGVDQSICVDFYAPLDGNDVSGIGGTGVWTSIGLTADITDATLFNTGVTNLDPGINTLRWTVISGAEGCTDSDEIVINNGYFTISAGFDQVVCSTDAVLAGEEPGPPNPGISGTWTLVAGSGTVTNPTLYNSPVAGLARGDNLFRWDVSSGICFADDDVTVRNNSTDIAEITIPAVGSDETCDGIYDLRANNPNPIYGTGQWSLFSGAGTFSSITNFQTTITGLAQGPNVIFWTITNPSCSSNTSVTIYNNEVFSNAGTDQTLCTNFVNLSAGDPAYGSGTWTNVGTPGPIIVDPTSNTTVVTNLNGGLNTFRWTVTAGSCSTLDDVKITNNFEPAEATNISTCNTTTQLNGNDPSLFTNPGTGVWTNVVGAGTIVNPTLFNTFVTGLNQGIASFNWAVTSGICNDNITIQIENNTFNLSAGIDVAQCGNTYTLSGTPVPPGGTGNWSFLGGSGNIIVPGSHNSLVTNLQQGDNVLLWSVTNAAGCDNDDDVMITNNNPNPPQISIPSGVGETCDGIFDLQANDPAPEGIGLWSVGGSGTFSSTTFYHTTVSGLTPGSNTIIWTVRNNSGLCPLSESVTIINNVVRSEAGPAQTRCFNYATLGAADPLVVYPFQGTGAWSTNISEIVIANSLSETSFISNIPNGPNELYWTVTEGSCSITDTVLISNYSVTASGTDAISCTSDIAELTGNNPAPGESGLWTNLGGVTFDDPTLYNTGAHNLVSGVNTLTWTINNAFGCTDFENIVVNYIQPTVNPGSDQDLCVDYTFMTAQTPAPGSGVWTLHTGTGTFANPSSHNTSVSNIGIGANVYRWAVNDRGCTGFDFVTINNNMPFADAGSDLNTCFDIFSLNAVEEQAGETGIWINIGGTGIITTPTLYNSQVTNLNPGVNAFRWTVDNGLCDNNDEVFIFNNEISTDAGLDQSICSNTADLAANNPDPGTGYWTVIFPPGPVFDNSLAYNTVVTNLALGTNTFRWTATNGGCNAEDDVTISNNNPTIADAGDDQTVCDEATDLAGNNPPVGTGVWTLLGGTGTIVNPSQYNSPVTDLSSGVNTFEWTITNGSCESSDDVLIMNDVVFVYAGMDALTCIDSYDPLKGNQPGDGETGEWDVISGDGVLDNSALYNSGVTGLSAGENQLRWTITRGVCDNSDIVSIFNNTPSEAIVGDDQENCADTAVIDGNDPATGVGEWSIASGNGVFDNSSNFNTTVRNLIQGTNKFRWTITNGSCENFDEITIINNSVTAIVCDTVKACGTEDYLYGNEPLSGQTGVWTVIAGTGILDDSNNHNTAVSNLNPGINIFRWTISNGTCLDYANLVVINNLDTAYAEVQGPSTICTDIADISGNIPIPGWTGYWKVVGGNGVFDNSLSPITTIRDLNKGVNTLRWYITREDCEISDDVTITNNMVVATAGNDQISCGSDVNLSANEILPGETGLWTNESGSGTILTPSDNETVVTNLTPGANAMFKWTVWGNGCVDSDEVQVFEQSFLIEAGPAQTLCSTDAILSGEDPAPGTGLWTTDSGVTINNTTSHITTVTGLQDNSSHTFLWTVTRNSCTAFDEVVITNNLVHAHAGDDKPTCYDNVVLNASNPVAGTGLWNIALGTGIITTPTYYATSVTNISSETITLTWTVTNGNCSDSDHVTIDNNTIYATAGLDKEICDNFINLNGTPPEPGGYGEWQDLGSGYSVIETPSAYNTYVSNLQRGVNTFKWIVYENGCTNNGGDNVRIFNNSFDADAGLDQTLELYDTDTYFDAELPPNSTGQWSVTGGSGIIDDFTSAASYVSGMLSGENKFTWTVMNSQTECIDTDEVTITVADFTLECGPDQVICTNTAVMNAEYETGVDTMYHTWSRASGTGDFDDIHDNKTVVRNIDIGINVYKWTVDYVGFEASCTVNVTNDSIFAYAGDDATLCEDYHIMNAQQISGGSGIWTAVGSGGATIVNSTLHNTLITDLQPGTSLFEWHVYDYNGHCESFDTVAINHTLAPIANFSVDPAAFCAPAMVNINNLSDYYHFPPGLTEPDEFQWSVEGEYLDTTYSVDVDLNIVFDNTGTEDSTYNIQLIAIDYETGCRDTVVRSITAHASPFVKFDPSSNEIRFPSVEFGFENFSDSTLTTYHWDFGDNSNIHQDEWIGYVYHAYSIWGTYIVTLTGTSGGECNGQWIDTLVILPPCPDSYDEPSTIAQGCQPLLVEFNSNLLQYPPEANFADSVRWEFYNIHDENYLPIISYDINPEYEYPEPGIYHPRLIAWNSECGKEQDPSYERIDTVIVYPRPIVEFDVSPRMIMVPNQAIHCYNYSQYGSRYLWNFGDTISFDEEPLHYYQEPGVYDIILNVWSEYDCFQSDTIRNAVFAEEPGMIVFPNAFTPNPNGACGGVYPCTGNRIDTDNLNDVFYPLFSGVVDYELEIYNRWGEKIYVSNDICIGWDGYVHGVLAPQDVYVWKVSVVYKNGEPYKKYGSVTLLR